MQNPQGSYANSGLQVAKTMSYIMGNKQDELITSSSTMKE
ncbi:hypothetical protein CES85_0964 [Ochrobactrum quorumnocens]|uniref:Uncharacterized protein n=1 Tax=Ochrobactrum quorumnocens TaxID=271865 RepID=A0A248UHK1_9HYPH|nr:hypothetical protein CES85_0964 [[Ochrobactrum] quorumnocens]